MREGNLRPRFGEIAHDTFNQRKAVVEDHSSVKDGAGAWRTTMLHQNIPRFNREALQAAHSVFNRKGLGLFPHSSAGCSRFWQLAVYKLLKLHNSSFEAFFRPDARIDEREHDANPKSCAIDP